MLVDDHEIVRDGLRALLLGNQRIQLAGEASNAQDFFQLIKKEPPDVAILDIALPGMSGIDIARQLQQEHSPTQVLMLSANTQEAYVIAAVRAGARGFLSKDCSQEALLEAIEVVYRGDLYFGTNITHTVFKTFVKRIKEKASEPIEELSEREMQVLQSFAEGLSYKEIAHKLHITSRTVETHKKHIFEKLHFQNNVDLVKYAIKEGLVPLD